MKLFIRIFVGIVFFIFLLLPTCMAQFNNAAALQSLSKSQSNMLNAYKLSTSQQDNKEVQEKLQSTPQQPVQTYQTVDRSAILKRVKENNQAPQEKNQNLSVIEKIFGAQLKQFGYEMFNRQVYSAKEGNNAPSYRLNIGDKVNVYLWGDTVDYMNMSGQGAISPFVDTVVDNDGTVFLPGIGAFPALGMTTAAVRDQITQALSAKYTDIAVDVTVRDPRDFPILVMGSVQHPGNIYVNSSSTILDAVNLAGGILKIGSLRDVDYIDSYTHKVTNVDLYQLLLKGKYNQIFFKEGDVVLVKPIGGVIGFDNGVKRPAIYEYKKGETLSDLINYAGGLLPSVNPDNISIQSYNTSSGQKDFKETTLANLASISPSDGALLTFNTMYDVAENVVRLEGNVKHPEEFQYQEGMKLSDILKSKDELLNQTFTAQAIINRFQGQDKDIVTIPVSLEDFFNGRTNPSLKPQDRIKIFSTTNMSMVEIVGEVQNPGLIPYYEGMKLKDLLADVAVIGDPNNLAVEITNNIETFDFEKTYPELVEQQIPLEDLDEEDIKIGKYEKMGEEKDIFDPLETYLKRNRVQSIYLYDLLTLNQTEKNLDLFPGDKVFLRPLRDNEKLKSVSIVGYVNKPGIYQIKPGMTLTDAINIAGGPAYNAYLPGLVFLRTAVSKVQKDALKRSMLELQEEISVKLNAAQNLAGDTVQIEAFLLNQKQLLDVLTEKAKQEYGRIVLDITQNDLSTIAEHDNLPVEDGDEIIVPNRPMYVIVVGEVYNQSAIAYNPNMPAEYYLDKVGGITKRAQKKNVYVIKTNGTVRRPKHIAAEILDPGDAIVVPKKVKVPLNVIGLVSNITQIISSTASSVYVLVKL